AVIALAEKARDVIIAAALDPFARPINNEDGTPGLEAGEKATDRGPGQHELLRRGPGRLGAETEGPGLRIGRMRAHRLRSQMAATLTRRSAPLAFRTTPRRRW